MTTGGDAGQDAAGNIIMQFYGNGLTQVEIGLAPDYMHRQLDLMEIFLNLNKMTIVEAIGKMEKGAPSDTVAHWFPEQLHQFFGKGFFMVKTPAHHQTKGADIEGGHGQLTDNWGSHRNDRLDWPEIMANRVDQSETAEHLRIFDGKELGDSAADIMSNTVNRSKTQALYKAVEDVTLLGQGVRDIKRFGRVATTKKINTDNPISILQEGDNSSPYKRVGGDSMHQQDRFTSTCLMVGYGQIIDVAEQGGGFHNGSFFISIRNISYLATA